MLSNSLLTLCCSSSLFLALFNINISIEHPTSTFTLNTDRLIIIKNSNTEQCKRPAVLSSDPLTDCVPQIKHHTISQT